MRPLVILLVFAAPAYAQIPPILPGKVPAKVRPVELPQPVPMPAAARARTPEGNPPPAPVRVVPPTTSTPAGRGGDLLRQIARAQHAHRQAMKKITELEASNRKLSEKMRNLMESLKSPPGRDVVHAGRALERRPVRRLSTTLTVFGSPGARLQICNAGGEWFDYGVLDGNGYQSFTSPVSEGRVLHYRVRVGSREVSVDLTAGQTLTVR